MQAEVSGTEKHTIEMYIYKANINNIHIVIYIIIYVSYCNVFINMLIHMCKLKYQGLILSLNCGRKNMKNTQNRNVHMQSQDKLF